MQIVPEYLLPLTIPVLFIVIIFCSSIVYYLFIHLYTHIFQVWHTYQLVMGKSPKLFCYYCKNLADFKRQSILKCCSCSHVCHEVCLNFDINKPIPKIKLKKINKNGWQILRNKNWNGKSYEWKSVVKMHFIYFTS